MVLRQAASQFPHPAVQPAIGKWFWIVPAESNPARFRPAAEVQTAASALADAAKSTQVNFAFPCRTQSDPNRASVARSVSFSAGGQIPFPARGVSAATIPEFRFFAAQNRQRRSQTTASLVDNSPAWFATAKI